MKKDPIVTPRQQRILTDFGEKLKLARLRRRLSAAMVSQRAGISRPTLSNIESGSHTVSLGNYFLVMCILGLEKDFEKLALDDELGRTLQDLEIATKKRAPKRKV